MPLTLPQRNRVSSTNQTDPEKGVDADTCGGIVVQCCDPAFVARTTNSFPKWVFHPMRIRKPDAFVGLFRDTVSRC